MVGRGSWWWWRWWWWCVVVVVVVVVGPPATAIKWLALSRVATVAVATPGSSQVCESFRGSLVRQQVRFCKENPVFMDSVKRGAIWAIEECQFQFRTRRWNCSTLNDEAIEAFKKAFKPKPPPEPIIVSNKTERAAPSTTRPDLTFHTSGGGGGGGAAAAGGGGGSGESSPQPPPGLPPSPNHYQNTSPARPTVTRQRRGRKAKKKIKRKRNRGGEGGGGGGGGGGIVGPYPIVPQGTREAAFVHAISSAGVAHAITRRCSSGELDDCGCDRSVRGVTRQGFQWSGCSDNIAYGVSLSKRFVDARDRKLVKRKRSGRVSSRALMNLHNNEAGRKLIEVNMRVECKCHGVSGSCELKTCWKAMPTFREIGEILKEKFDGATEVRVKEVSGRAELEPNKQYFKKPTEVDLVYVASSPEYCDYDINSGSLGTQGRRCNKTSRGLDGCDLLCCSRGYTSSQEQVKERCSCKFHWCCYVKCGTCIRDTTVHTCK